MPAMSASESSCCRSAPWALLAGRLVGWAVQDAALTGDVLEIGGGSGAMAQRLASYAPTARITVTDIDPLMIDTARVRLACHPNTAVQIADTTQLPFDSACFDVVVSFLMLHHVIDWESAVAEAARVLRPGGRFIGYDITDTPVSELLHRVDGSPHRLIGSQQLEPALRDSGLVPERLRFGWFGHVVRFRAYRPD